MAEVKWIKLDVDTFDNRKIKHIRKLPEGDSIALIWVMLLTMAGRCNDGGRIYLTETIPYTTKMLADEMDFEESTVVLALQAFERFGMIYKDREHIVITGWEEHQNIDRLTELREYNRLAQKKSREKKRLLKDVNDTSMTSQRCQGAEVEEDKEKELHSFVHSAHEDDDWDSFSEEAKLKYIHGTLGEGIVLMSKEQFDDLLDKLSLDELHKYFEVIKECEKNGKHYKRKSHYQAILDMARKDRRVK